VMGARSAKNSVASSCRLSRRMANTFDFRVSHRSEARGDVSLEESNVDFELDNASIQFRWWKVCGEHEGGRDVTVCGTKPYKDGGGGCVNVSATGS
jgi:hypothetical protein